jgi:hypothetical protein
MEDSVKLTDTQRLLLSAASQRDDRALERPMNLPGGAAGKVVAKLLTEGLIEEIASRGALPVWRRHEDGARTLRITRRGLESIRVEDDASGAAEPTKKPARPINEIAQGGPAARQTRATSRQFQAGQRNRNVEPPPGGDDCGGHETERVAAALGSWLLRRDRAQEAGADARVGKGRRGTRLSDSGP